MVSQLLPYLQLLLTACNILIMGYAFVKFLNKPHDSLEEKYDVLKRRADEQELELKSIKRSLSKGNDNFQEQERSNATFQSVMLSFVNFEIAYCLHTDYKHTEELIKAKNTLENYINREKKGEGYESD